MHGVCLPKACSHSMQVACLVLLLVSSSIIALGYATSDSPAPPARSLKRSEGKRWTDKLAEYMESEIKVNTHKWLQDRGRSLGIPLEIDLLFLGFDGDGAFHFKLDTNKVEEMLATTMPADNKLCPSVWETGKQTSLCFRIDYVTLPTKYTYDGLHRVESALRSNMVHVGDRKAEGGSSAVQVYEVEASAIEDELHHILMQVYAADERPLPSTNSRLADQHAVIVFMNPHKLRMSPLTTPAQGAAAAGRHENFIQEWSKGHISQEELIEQEGGYVYRYKYNGRGAAGSWISKHNFLVVDISAGPSSYGPTSSPGGQVAPVALPRLMPMMMRLARELETGPQFGSLHEHLLQEAAHAQQALFAGQLAGVVSSATQHVLCPDIALHRVEHAQRVMVPIVVMQDHDDFSILEQGDPAAERYGGEKATIDTVQVQKALDSLVDHEQEAFITVSGTSFTQQREVLMALHKAKVSWSDAVMSGQPYQGLHRVQHVYLDSGVLMRELRRLLPMYQEPDEVLVGEDELGDSEADAPAAFTPLAKRSGSRQVVVFVLSLRGAHGGLAFENNQLVAAEHDMVVVLQLLEQPSAGAGGYDIGSVYSGHIQEGRPVPLHGALGVTGRIIGGLATALAGVVPPFERLDRAAGEFIEDWRWSVGAIPWGPYANSSQLSQLFVTAARRNNLIRHVEAALTAVQSRLDAFDDLVEVTFQGPFHELEVASSKKGRRHYLDALSSRSHGYNETLTPDVVSRLEGALGKLEERLQRLSFSLYAREFEEAESRVPLLLADVDTFVKEAHEDMQRTRAVAACCSLRHSIPLTSNTFAIIAFVLLLAAFVAVVVVAITSQKLFRPTGGKRKKDADWRLPQYATLPR